MVGPPSGSKDSGGGFFYGNAGYYMTQKWLPIFWSACLLFLGASSVPALTVQLSPEEIDEIGAKVFQNECASKDDMLVQWNEGEKFLSLGIGHFIWYPSARKGPFQESFPEFVHYAKESGKKIPAWLDADPFPTAPWPTRRIFLRHQNDRNIRELRQFLASTKRAQAAFLVHRLQRDVAVILDTVPEARRGRIEKQFHRLVQTPAGTYALIDYVNFKGSGILPTERYKGQGWGLLQVLEGMRDETEAPDALKEFVRVAENLLKERIRNSPPARNEKRWLPGWQNRVQSYREP